MVILTSTHTDFYGEATTTFRGVFSSKEAADKSTEEYKKWLVENDYEILLENTVFKTIEVELDKRIALTF